MPEIDVQNIQTYHAAIVVKSLAANGLEHVIISPGSRSTPLTLAFAAHPKIKSHVVIDERSAAFVALGIASASGKPAALVCTSGTAVANYFPAVAEAQKAGLPILVLSADRDFNEMNTGANQWIDQINLFGNKAVFFAQIKPKENDQRDISRLEYLVHQAWIESINKGGCAHLNFPFRKPLEPSKEFVQSLHAFYITSEASNFSVTKSECNFTLDNLIRAKIESSKAPVVIISGGIRNTESIELVKMFSSAGIPVLSEAGSLGSGLSTITTYIDGANSFLRNPDISSELVPDLIIRFGDEPVGKGILTYLKVHQGVPTFRFSERMNWSNSTFSPENLVLIHGNFVPGDLTEFKLSLNPDWFQMWQNQMDKVGIRRKNLFSAENQLMDGDVYEILSQFLREEEVIFVSNSFPARDIDTFGDVKLKSRRILMNRGASGIDGIISTAIGVSLKSDEPVTLIIGDLAFAHDLSALILFKNLEVNLRIIVINNDGGGIFEMLPVSNSEFFDSFFRTPQNIDASALAKAAGLSAIKVTTSSQLRSALSSSQRYQVIECITDQTASMVQRKALWG